MGTFILGPVAGLDFSGVVEDAGTSSYTVGTEVYGTARGALAELVLVGNFLLLSPSSFLSRNDGRAHQPPLLRHLHVLMGVSSLLSRDSLASQHSTTAG
jgi:hypothetical protein